MFIVRKSSLGLEANDSICIEMTFLLSILHYMDMQNIYEDERKPCFFLESYQVFHRKILHY
jgi:hypothetical protein